MILRPLTRTTRINVNSTIDDFEISTSIRITKTNFRYIQLNSKWLPPSHYLICDVEFTLAQLLGSEGPSSLQEMPEEKLQLKVTLCKKLLGIFGVIAAGE